MGWDVSYHPVDVAFFHEQLFPLIRGEREAQPLFDAAARIAKTRFIANAFGLAVADVLHDVEIPMPPNTSPPLGRLGRLFGSKSGAEEETYRQECAARDAEIARLEGTFDSDLHVWGRPFFIVSDDPSEVSRLVDRYVAADAAGAAEIAREMVRRINPALLNGAKASSSRAKTFGEHLAKQLDRLPDEDEVEKSVTWKVQLFIDAWKALKTGGPVRDVKGAEHDPAELFRTDFPLAMMEFASLFRPGWMERGTVWPTNLLTEAGLDAKRFFETPAALFAPIIERVPQVAKNLRATIEENYSLGGYVPARKVEALLQFVREHRREMKDVYDAKMTDTPIYLVKLEEAIIDAAGRGIAFLEATEVYSGPLGAMN
jgi:hypothetical protein